MSESSTFLKHANPFPVNFDHSPLLGMLPETKVTTLPNGMRVATETIPFAETATVGVWINSGSRFENDNNNGAAHFLEHMLFKGTKKRSEAALAQEADSMGGHFNAFTGREMTCYYGKVLGKDVRKAVGLLADVLTEPLLDVKTVEAEKAAILAEMEQKKCNSDVLFDHMHATAFQWSPLGRTVMGPIENIKAMSKETLAGYMQAHYRGERMVLAAAGAVNHDELVKYASDMFAGIKPEAPGTSVKDLIAKEPSFWTGSEVRDRRPDVQELVFSATFKGAAWTDPDSVPLMVMQTMLGAWDKNNTVGHHSGSLLVQAWAAGGFGDAVAAFNTNYLDTGLFGIYGVTCRERGEDAAFSVMNEMTRMCYEVTEPEVMRARNQLKSALLFAQDSTHHVAESLGRDLLVYGRRLPMSELFARIDAVDAKAVRGVADRFIYDQDVVVTAVGDTQHLIDYNGWRRRTFWLRY